MSISDVNVGKDVDELDNESAKIEGEKSTSRKYSHDSSMTILCTVGAIALFLLWVASRAHGNKTGSQYSPVVGKPVSVLSVSTQTLSQPNGSQPTAAKLATQSTRWMD